RFEKNGGNDTVATATPLGALPGAGSVSLGLSVGTTQLVAPTDTDFVSIDGTSDTDVYSLTAVVGSRLAITLTPVGPSYLSGAQGGPSPTLFDASAQSDLALQVLNGSGAVVASANSGGLGVAESIPQFDTPLGGTFYLKVTGAQDVAQMYKLAVVSSLVSPAV